jgi:WD40 repeat protein
VGSASSPEVTLEQILQEKQTYDLSLRFEKMGVDDEEKGWRVPAPSHPTILDTLPSKSNVLSVCVQELPFSSDEPQPYILSTSADRRLNIIKPGPQSMSLLRSHTSLQDSPILDVTILGRKHLLLSSMSGKLVLYDCYSESVLEERRDHNKYIVKINTWTAQHTTFIATVGWDSKVLLYCTELNSGQEARLGSPIATLTLPSVPETAVFAPSADHPAGAVLVVTRRDSSFLYYYALPTPDDTDPEIRLLGKQNLAPHSNAWVAFTPSAVQICPKDPNIAAVATSSVPHMKLIIVRMLIPPNAPPSDNVQNIEQALELTQASQARAELVIQNREEAAILVQCSTSSPQTQYSTPALAWRPDGTGIWVNGDDGIIRGIETTTGKVVVRLEGHEAGSKVRCLWAGTVRQGQKENIGDEHEEEWVVTGGFDHRLIVWKVQ